MLSREGFSKASKEICTTISKLFNPIKEVHIAVSGGFDPLTIGHVRYIQEAAKLGTRLTVILNTDNFLFKKKGYVFMDYHERKEVIEAIKGVDDVFMCIDLDDTVRKSLQVLRPNIFAKGGDRTVANIPEYGVCREEGIRVVFGIGGSDKPQSSSWLCEKVAKHFIDNIKLRRKPR
jgi:cytidyltransferase-like protein